MAAKKVLVVFGATGVQGGSVAKAFLGDAKLMESWTIRGVTRDVSKPSAKALESLGAETVAVSKYHPFGSAGVDIVQLRPISTTYLLSRTLLRAPTLSLLSPITGSLTVQMLR